MKKEKEKYKSSFLTVVIVDILGYIFILGIIVGIWIDEFRWKLIFTALFAIGLALLLTAVEKSNEEKFNESADKIESKESQK